MCSFERIRNYIGRTQRHTVLTFYCDISEAYFLVLCFLKMAFYLSGNASSVTFFLRNLPDVNFCHRSTKEILLAVLNFFPPNNSMVMNLMFSIRHFKSIFILFAGILYFFFKKIHLNLCYSLIIVFYHDHFI